VNETVDKVMTMLTLFTAKFDEFSKWIRETNDTKLNRTEEYVKRFENIFNVTDGTNLLREIQDIKDELMMLNAVFEDQVRVLKDAGNYISEDRAEAFDTRTSAFTFEAQSEKHGTHIKRMVAQADQAYANVITSSPATILNTDEALTNHAKIVERLARSETAAGKCP
jgi:hypothetical protein